MEDKEENKDYKNFIMPEEYRKAQEELVNKFNFWLFNGGGNIILNPGKYTKEEIDNFNKEIRLAYKEEYERIQSNLQTE